MESIKNKLKYFVLLLVLTSCIANDFLVQENRQRPKWRNWLSQLDAANVPQEYYLSDQNEQSDHVFPYADLYDEEYDSEKELESSNPYGIQNVREVKGVDRPRVNNNNNGKLTFQSLCPSRRQTIHLNRDSVYEFRPDHYEEVSCVAPFHNDRISRNKVCGEAGFSCIQLNRTIFLTRREHGKECWETETRLVLAGCECMWPKHNFGDIATHH